MRTVSAQSISEQKNSNLSVNNLWSEAGNHYWCTIQFFLACSTKQNRKEETVHGIA